jgi:hypothetical protein
METADVVSIIGAISGLIVALGVTFLIVRIGTAIGKFSSSD